MIAWDDFIEFFKNRCWPIVGVFYTEVIKAASVYFILKSCLLLFIEPSIYNCTNLLCIVLVFTLMTRIVNRLNKILK